MIRTVTGDCRPRPVPLGRDDVFAILDAQAVQRRTDGLSVCLSVHPRADQGGCAGKVETGRQSAQAAR